MVSAETATYWIVVPILLAVCLGAWHWLKYGERRTPPADDDNNPDDYCA